MAATLSFGLTKKDPLSLIRSFNLFPFRNPFRGYWLVYLLAGCLALGGAWVIFYQMTQAKPIAYLKKSHPDFVGRREYLQLMKNNFIDQGEKQEAEILVLFGEGGIGKTELAIHFGNTYLSHFSFVFSINCSTKESLKKSYRMLCQYLDVRVYEDEPIESMKRKAHDFLEQIKFQKPWLLIFDNAENFIDVPLRGYGRVVITSRTKDLWTPFNCVEVLPFAENEACALLDKILPQKGSEADVASLIQLFHSFPMVLNQIAHYIAETPETNVSNFLSLVKKNKLFVIESMPKSERYPYSLTASWQFTYQALREKAPLALEWLQFCSYLYPEEIPISWLERWLQDVKKMKDSMQCKVTSWKILHTLASYSVIRYHEMNQSFSLHRLGQEVLQKGDENALQKKQALKFLYLLPSNFDEDHFEESAEDWDVLQNWELHASWYLAHYSFHHAQLELAKLSQTLGIYKYIKGEYAEALELQENALTAKHILFSEDHLEIASSKHLLGIVLERLGKYDQAIENLSAALELRKKHLGADSSPVAASSHHLGWSLLKEGQYPKAKELFEKALLIKERLYGKKHASIATTVNYLGWTHYKLGNYQLAKKLTIQALKLRKKLFGKKHPCIARSLNDLGVILGKMGEYSDSEQSFLKAWEIRKSLFGEVHPDISHSIYDLAIVLEKQGKLAQAKQMHKKALKMKENLFSDEDHPEIANSLYALALVLAKQDHLHQALRLHKQSLEIRKKCFPENHPKIADSFFSLAEIYEKQNRRERALSLYQQSYHIREKLLGKEHPDTILLSHKLRSLKE